METASDSSARSSSLSTTAEDLGLHRFYAAIGDHPAALCEALKDTKEAPHLQRPWTIILPELESEEGRLTAWEASSKDVPRPRTPYTDALEARVETLFAQSMTDLDTDLALFAVRTYVKRISLFHGRTYDLFKSGRFAELADQLDLDDKNLAGLLPDKEKPLVDKYKRLIRFNQEYRRCTDDAGNWVQRKAPPLEVPDKFVLAWRWGISDRLAFRGRLHLLFLTVPQLSAGILSRMTGASSGLLRSSRLDNPGSKQLVISTMM